MAGPGNAKELARQRVRGLWIAMPTPFTRDGDLDEDLLERSVEHYIDGLGVDGIYCGGVMGEFWALSTPERRRLHERVADFTAGRVPLMAHTGHETFRDMVELSEHAGEVGIEFGIVINPYYPPDMPEELVLAWFERLCAATQQPIFLFNTVFSGTTLAPSTIAKLADLDNICGIKNPRDHEHLLEVQRLVGERIVVTDAAEKDWLDLHLHHGFQSLMSTPALAMYQTPDSRPIAEYTALADNGDVEAAWKLQGTLAEHRKAFRRWLRDPWAERRVVPIAHLKAWLEMTGLPQGPVRPPLIEISPEERGALREDLQRLALV